MPRKLDEIEESGSHMQRVARGGDAQRWNVSDEVRRECSEPWTRIASTFISSQSSISI